jgi:hypothetical protein
MTLQELTTNLDLTVFHLAEPERAVTGAYCGDLLTWVMANAPADGAWLTIMSNVNVAAVAVLTDVSCIILTEGVKPDAPLLARAQTQGINLLGAGLSTYECALQLGALLK